MIKRLSALATILLLSLLAGRAWATAYSLPAASFAACSGTWIASSYTCQNGSVTLQAGDTLTATQALTLYADKGFNFNGNNTLGSSSVSVSLKTSYGTTSVGAGSVLYGSLNSDSGAITLVGTRVYGSITAGSGTISLTGSSVSGTVSGSGTGSFSASSVSGTVSFSNGLTASGTTFSSTLTSTNGAVSLSGGSVAGLVNVGCCQVTVSGGATISNGILAGNNGITVSDSTVSGALNAGNNPIKLTNVTMTSGSINPGSNNVTISGGNITASITDANNVYIQQGATVTGDVQARYTVTLTASTLTGDIYGSTGYTLQHVYLNQSSTIYGDVTVGTSWQTIEGDSSANHIYGVCTYAKVNPASLCQSAPSSPVHHYQLAYASQALICQAQTVTVSACADAACSTRYTSGTSSLAVSPGGSSISFVGSTTTSIAVRSVQTVSLAVSNASPAAVNATLCRIDGGTPSSNCNLTFADSGLLVQAPDLVAGQDGTLSVTAVRASDKNASCVPAFANVTRPVAFQSIYNNPNVGNRQVVVGGSAVVNGDAGWTSVNLSFNAQGKATPTLGYLDAGQVQLNALYQGSASFGDAGLTMSGSGSFVSRPASLGIVATRPDGSSLDGSTCLDASGAPTLDAAGCGTWKAGDVFILTVTPLAADGSTVTPNFRLDGIALGSTLLAPSGGVDGSLTPSSYNHPLGGAHVLRNEWHSEVGVFRLSAQGSYFGYDVSGQSAAVGRFTPAYLNVTASAQLQPPSCKDANNNDIRSAFSYQGQIITFKTSPSLTVTAMNAQNYVTRNYDFASFWRLTVAGREPYVYPPFKGTDEGARSARLKGRWESLVGQVVSHDDEPPVEEGANDGDGQRIYRWPNDSLRWMTSLNPTDDDLPFGSIGSCTSKPTNNGNCIARLVVKAVEMDNTVGEKVCFAPGDGWTGASGCTEFTYDFGGSEVRLGRLRFGNAFGSELQGLDVPFWLESWKNVGTAAAPLGAFRTETGDACSAPLLGKPALKTVAGSLQPGDFGTLAPPVLTGGAGLVRLAAPGKEGSVSVGLEGLEGASPAVPWLLYDWNGSATRQAARGLATFGIYRGSDALIFRRESYR